MPQLRAAPPGLVDVADYDDSIVVDMAYRNANNFTGKRVNGYASGARGNHCYLREGAARAVASVNSRLQQSGLKLVMKDCYRPQRASRSFILWANSKDQYNVRNKVTVDRLSSLDRFYFQDPVLFDRNGILRPSFLMRNSYLSGGVSRHNIGSTVDVELYYTNGSPADAGTAHDVFSKKSAFGAAVGAEARRIRNLLGSAMRAQGFRGLRSEWWHWTHRASDGAAPLDYPVD